MAIYEYRCTACGHPFEAMQKMSDPPLTDCPECGKPALQKLISAAGFQLKGSGWYVTDFKGGAAKKDPSATDSAANKDKPAASPAAETSSTPAATPAAPTRTE